MTDVVTRALREDELRAANTLFRASLHVTPPTDEEWTRLAPAYQPGRTLGAFDEELIGTARSTDATLTVPGGGTVATAAVTGVGVRADRTRRGVLTDLMRAQLADFTARAVPTALLYASEGAIYGRFGYGVGTRARSYTVDRRRARLRPEVPRGGDVALLDPDAAAEQLPDVYARLPLRPGMMTRPSHWWHAHQAFLRRGGEGPVVTVLHHGEDGPDGFAVYRVVSDAERTVLRVLDLQVAGAHAFAGLWRFLLGVDLVDEITATLRPLDEPVELLFTDPRACRVTAVQDEAWLRLVDVPAALRARQWDGEPLVIEVDDPVLEHNTGRYRVSPGEVRRTDAPPALRLGVDALAMVFLGGWRPSMLAQVGRAVIPDPEAARRADALAGTRAAPWCGTFF